MTHPEKPPPFVDRDVSRSTDELKNKSPYWTVDLTQVEQGELEIHRLRVFSDELYYNWLSFSKKTIYKVTSPLGFKTFVIPSSENQKHIYFGHEVSSSHVLIVPDSGKVDGVIFPYSDFFILSIPVQDMQQVKTMAGIPNISTLAPQGAVSEPKQESFQHLLRILKDIDDLADTENIAKGFHAAVDSIKSALAECLAPMTEKKIYQQRKKGRELPKSHFNTLMTISTTLRPSRIYARWHKSVSAPCFMRSETKWTPLPKNI